jgi:hypothetical protein
MKGCSNLISYQHSLYSHEDEYIHQFNNLYLKWKPILPMQFTLNGSSIQINTDVFSLWINLIAANKKILPKVDKQLTHSYNFIRDAYLINHADIQEKMKHLHTNHDYCFVLSYYLMYNFLHLYLSPFKNSSELHLLESNGILNGEYYLYNEFTACPNDTYYVVQKILQNHLFTEFLSKDHKIKALITASIFETNDTILELVQVN